MKKAIISALRQTVSVRTAIACIMFTTVIFFGSSETVVRIFQDLPQLSHGYHTDFICTALGSEAVAAFVPILAVLPFSANYVDEIKNKFSYFCLIRSSYSSYVGSRICVCFLCSGMVMLVGVGIAWMGSVILFVPLESVNQKVADTSADLLRICVLLFLSGGFWSVVGMAMSTLMESKYISYATPFVFYYLLVILYERYFSDLFIIYPKNWTDPTAWPFGCWGAAIFLLEMTLIFAFLFAFRAGKRLQQL